jgi:coenzyme PQQ precursor peptide PqqA
LDLLGGCAKTDRELPWVEGTGASSAGFDGSRGGTMVWTTPTLIEICIGLEINGYLSPEF